MFRQEQKCQLLAFPTLPGAPGLPFVLPLTFPLLDSSLRSPCHAPWPQRNLPSSLLQCHLHTCLAQACSWGLVGAFHNWAAHTSLVCLDLEPKRGEQWAPVPRGSPTTWPHPPSLNPEHFVGNIFIPFFFNSWEATKFSKYETWSIWTTWFFLKIPLTRKCHHQEDGPRVEVAFPPWNPGSSCQ